MQDGDEHNLTTSMSVTMHIEKCELNINLFAQILGGQLNNTIGVIFQ